MTFPWLLMIFQSSTTFHDFSRKFIFPGFPDPVGTLVIAFSREIYRQFTLVVLLIYISLTIIDDIIFFSLSRPCIAVEIKRSIDVLNKGMIDQIGFQWRHNERDGVSNHRRLEYFIPLENGWMLQTTKLLNGFLRKKISWYLWKPVEYYKQQNFKWIFVKGNTLILILISPNFAHKDSIDNGSTLVQIMANRIGDRPLWQMMNWYDIYDTIGQHRRLSISVFNTMRPRQNGHDIFNE